MKIGSSFGVELFFSEKEVEITNLAHEIKECIANNKLVISDNRTTQHRAIDNYHGFSRTLKRIVLRENKN